MRSALINGTPHIGFMQPWSHEDEWMADEEIRAKINDIHLLVVRLDEQRVADVNEVANMKLLLDRLENRVWLAVAATAAAMGTAILSLMM